RRRIVTGLFLGLMVLLGYALQLGLLGLKADSAYGLLVRRVTSWHFTSYFSFAAGIPDLRTLFSGYLSNIGTCLHCQVHPPGVTFFYWLVLRAVSIVPVEWQHGLAVSIWANLGSNPATQSLKYSLTDTQTLGAVAGGTLVLFLAAAIVVPLFGLASLLG